VAAKIEYANASSGTLPDSVSDRVHIPIWSDVDYLAATAATPRSLFESRAKPVRRFVMNDIGSHGSSP
jgi:hypothetical protein